MCRNIKTLYNFEPKASPDEIHAAALQYVRKISGFRKPSQVNEKAFEAAIEDIARASEQLLNSLQTKAPKRDREQEAGKARERNRKRFA